MTPLYTKFMADLASSSNIVTWIAIFAAMSLTAYKSLDWTPSAVRSRAKRAFQFCILFFFGLVIILQARAMLVR